MCPIYTSDNLFKLKYNINRYVNIVNVVLFAKTWHIEQSGWVWIETYETLFVRKK